MVAKYDYLRKLKKMLKNYSAQLLFSQYLMVVDNVSKDSRAEFLKERVEAGDSYQKSKWTP